MNSRCTATMKSRAMPSSLSSRVVSSHGAAAPPAVPGSRRASMARAKIDGDHCSCDQMGVKAPAASDSTSARKPSGHRSSKSTSQVKSGALLAQHRGPARIDEEAEPVAQPLLLSRLALREHRAEARQQEVVELRRGV